MEPGGQEAGLGRHGGEGMMSVGDRTRRYALAVIRLCREMPRTDEGRVLSGQLLRAGTSVGAQYDEATRARSDAEFLSKMRSALQELAEAEYWLMLIGEADAAGGAGTGALLQETGELLGIVTACINNAARRGGGGRAGSDGEA